MTKSIWLAVSPDIYELPLAVADSRPELATMLNVKPQAITRMKMREAQGVQSASYKIRVVKV
jgi:hypothetical protein